MTELDCRVKPSGYFSSAWPAECGGPRRQKLVGTSGLNLQRGEVLATTSRDVGGWAVMFVQRSTGELYLQGGAGLREAEAPPSYRTDGPAAGWLERVHPTTLEPVQRSPDLPSGGWLWCGAVVVHANGDLYVVNGRYCHRLDPECNVVAERELPVDGPYNGLLLMSDGNIVTRNLGFREGDHASFVVLEPNALHVVGEPLVVEDRCMGRFSADLTERGEFVYFTTDREVRRLRYDTGELALDDRWRGSYGVGEGQSDGWDTTLGSDCVWMMDMGRPPGWMGGGTAPQRAFRFSMADPSERDVVDDLGLPGAWNPGPPLYDPVRQVLVHYDSVNGVVAAHRYRRPGVLEPLWSRDLRNFMQMMCWADTGELVVEDAQAPARTMGSSEGEVVIVDIETGAEKGRASSGTPATFGMFCCPGFGRDFYLASLPGAVARIFVA